VAPDGSLIMGAGTIIKEDPNENSNE